MVPERMLALPAATHAPGQGGAAQDSFGFDVPVLTITPGASMARLLG